MTTLPPLSKVWNLRFVQPADIEPYLHLPDFSNSSQQTRDLLDNITQLTDVHYPPWHRIFTIATHTILTLYLVAGFIVLLYRCRQRSFWLFRWHSGYLVPNSINTYLLVQAGVTIIWIGYAAATLRGRYVPSALLADMIAVPIGGWLAAWGSCFSIPTSSRRRTFSAKHANCLWVGIPLVFCINILTQGVHALLQYGKALSYSRHFRDTLSLQHDAASVTPEQLREATRVWSHIVAAWSYSSVLNVTCGAWAGAAMLSYATVLIHLLITFVRQNREHSLRSSDAMAQVNPVWSEAAPNRLETDLPRLQFAGLQSDSVNASRFFPPFSSSSSTAADMTDALFAKVLRNLLTSAILAMSAFIFIAYSCYFWAVAWVSGGLIVIGGGMFAEAVLQRVQPVLGSWQSVSTYGEVTAAEREAPRGARALIEEKQAQSSVLSRVLGPSKATRSQIERTSQSTFETKSTPSLTAGFHMPNAPKALAFPYEGKTGEEAEYILGNYSAPCRRKSSTHTMGMSNLSAECGHGSAHGIISLNMGHSNCTSSDDERSADLHPLRNDEAILSYREVLERRQLPRRTEVYFTRETTTYESARPTSRDAAQQSYESFNSWRYPANYIPRKS